MTALSPVRRPISLFEMPPSLSFPSFGAGADSNIIDRRLNSMRKLISSAVANLSTFEGPKIDAKDVSTQLRLKLTSFKRMTATVAMHLDADWRQSLFATLDRLIDPEDWAEDFDLPTEKSFSTFLRMIIYLHPTKRPGIGIAPNGNFVASWRREDDRIVIEALPDDQVRWVLSKTTEGLRERAAAQVTINRIPDVIAPYEPEALFNDGDKILA